MLTLDRLQELLTYHSDTGEFTWNVNHPRAAKDSKAGAKDYYGYIVIRLDGVLYKAHRLAWLHTYGKFPAKGLDHINQNKSDNRIQNLREANQSINMHNVSLKSTNKSGFAGVTWRNDRQKWCARIKVGYKTFNLGLYTDISNAIEARKLAELRLLQAFDSDGTCSMQSVSKATTG